jgi:hypothetical protein
VGHRTGMETMEEKKACKAGNRTQDIQPVATSTPHLFEAGVCDSSGCKDDLRLTNC